MAAPRIVPVGSCSMQSSASLRPNWFLALFLASLIIGTNSEQEEPKVKVKLSEGADIHDGILEFFHPLVKDWIAVCGDAIQQEDANVVCRELGFHGADTIRNVTRFTDGANYTALVNVWCESFDGEVFTALHECKRSGVLEGHPCDQKAPQITCLTTRLFGGSDASSGRLGVWSVEKGWGKVCSPDFGEKEQEVICRELGYRNRSLRAYTANQYEDSGRPYEWGNVVCTGSENRLTECNVDRTAPSTCQEDGDAFAACTSRESDQGTPPYLAVRLADGPCETEGRLEVFDGQVWGTVCQEEITNIDAVVICRQLGFNHKSAEVVQCCDTYPGARPGVSELFGVLNCTGPEEMINQCPHPDPGSRLGCIGIRHGNDVGIRCQTCQVKKANIAAIIGGVIGFIVLVIVIVVVLWYVCYIPKSTYQTAAHEKDDDEDDDNDNDVQREKPSDEQMKENDLSNGNKKEELLVQEDLDESDLQERTVDTNADSFV